MNFKPHLIRQRLTYIFLFLLAAAFCTSAFAKEKNQDKGKNITDKMKRVFNGFSFGAHERLFPYLSLEDWFDPYVGLKLKHCVLGSANARMAHHVKFETVRDFSWKLRYDLNSLSPRTKLSFLFKIKFDRDAYFYGIGNSTEKKNRLGATYSSVFLGTEIRHPLGQKLVFLWSPGYWRFKSGLEAGGEFEDASDAKYITSRFTLSDRYPVDYRNTRWDQQWSSYIEIGLPVGSNVSSYARINLEQFMRIPIYKNSKLGIRNRIEFLIAANRDLLPYFAAPELGSRSGLRGFSKGRFRNFTLHGLSLEYSIGLGNSFESFLLLDVAQTDSNLKDLFGAKIHSDYGIGVRVLSLAHPLSFGVANSVDGWKLFSNVSLVF